MPSVSQSRTNTRAEEVARKLKGIERYNPNCRPMLEEYVQYQIDNRFYDFDANMALLKMYQFDPSNFQSDKVADILLLALTNLPKPDFLLCKYLLDTQKVFFIFLLNLKLFVFHSVKKVHGLLKLYNFQNYLNHVDFKNFG
jgi:hypothetical protein